MYISRLPRRFVVPATNGRRGGNSDRCRSRPWSWCARASINTHGYLGARCHAIDGARWKVEACDRSLKELKINQIYYTKHHSIIWYIPTHKNWCYWRHYNKIFRSTNTIFYDWKHHIQMLTKIFTDGSRIQIVSIWDYMR